MRSISGLPWAKILVAVAVLIALGAALELGGALVVGGFVVLVLLVAGYLWAKEQRDRVVGRGGRR